MIKSLYNKIITNRRNTIIFIIILTILASIPIFTFGSIANGHDITFHLSRIKGISDNIKDFNVFSGIYKGYFNKYGYANGLFYPDLFLFFPAILHALGMKIITSYKLFVVIINFLSILSMYITVKGISKNKYAAIMSSIIYAFAPYRLVDLYQRAALGEALAFIFIPLVFYGLYEIVFGDYKKYWLLTIGMSGLILSHILSTYMVGIVLFLFCLINIKRFIKEKKRIAYLFLAALITLLLTSYFLLPMIEQMTSQTFKYSNTSTLEQFVLSNRVTNPLLLFLEIPNLYKYLKLEYWLPAGIGIIYIYLIYTLILNRKKNDKFSNQSLVISLVILVLVCITPFWELNVTQKLLYLVQFPWRFYMFPTVLLTICGCSYISKEHESLKVLRMTFLVSMISLISMCHFAFTNANIIDQKDYYASFAEYLPIEVDRDYINIKGDLVTSNNTVNSTITDKGSYYEVNFKQRDNQHNTYLELPLIYYKGYTAKMNNENLKVFKNNNGLVNIEIGDIPEGKAIVKYSGTILQHITLAISLLSLVLFSIFIYKEVKHEK